ncbi:hypothetical protein FXO37_01133 [Capsicum annuum]|nr:hypothetical protein FXO37_01133 [Capsicum annuum]
MQYQGGGKNLLDYPVIYFKGGDLLTKMEEALPWKSRDDIINHYKILIEDVDAIESGHCMQMTLNMPMESYLIGSGLYNGLFLRGLAIYGRGDWRSIARNCVITRTSIQVASHAQKYFNRLKAVNKENRGMSIHDIRMSIHDITIVDAEVAGTSLVPYTEGMIWPACGGSQAVASTSNQSMLPAEQMIAVAGGESSGHGTAFVSGMNSMSDEDDFILHIDDLIVDPEDANESKFPVDGGRSQLPSKQPCTACSSGTNNHPIFRVGSELEALITKQSGMTSFAVASIGANNAPQNTVATHSGMCSYPVASFGANSAPENMVAGHP